MQRLGGVAVGGSSPIRIMGVINASPESFHKGSVHTTKKAIRDMARAMEADGADYIDIGGMSTAPYLSTMVSTKTESRRVTAAVRAVLDSTNLPVSVDTCRATVARDALAEGAAIINDISGLKYDPEMRMVLEEHRPSVILCAHSSGIVRGDLVVRTKELITQSVQLAVAAGVSRRDIAVDPAIGFFRRDGRGPFYTRVSRDWVGRDVDAIKNLRRIKGGLPIMVSVSNKSFLGMILGRERPADRVFGTAAAEALCVIHGADIIRTHDVGAARDAVMVAGRLT